MMFIFVLAKNVLQCHFIQFVFPPQSLVTIAPLKQWIVSLRMEEQFNYQKCYSSKICFYF